MIVLDLFLLELELMIPSTPDYITLIVRRGKVWAAATTAGIVHPSMHPSDHVGASWVGDEVSP